MPIRYLTIEEIRNIRHEIAQSNHLFGNHADDDKYKRIGLLRSGVTVWLSKENEQTYNVESFPTIWKIIKEVAKDKKIGRAYIHQLRPTNNIPLHTDNYRTYYNAIDRYHVYLSIPTELEILHTGEPIEANSLMLFNHKGFHRYDNKSTQNTFFVVFDVYKE